MLVALMKPNIFQIGEEFVRVSSTRSLRPAPPPTVRPSVRPSVSPPLGNRSRRDRWSLSFSAALMWVVYDYMVACYPQDTIDCADVLGGEVVPIDSVGGALPRSYSRVLTNLTVRH